MRIHSRCWVIAALLCSASCGGSSSPSGPSVVVQSVQVTVAGNASATLLPGETRQLVATSTRSDGTTADVTATSAWQSSAPSLVSVSPSGLVTATAEGSADISATYNGVRGALRTEVRPTCTVSVTPASAAFSAFGGSSTVAVTVNSPSCRWSARSDAAWFLFTFEPAAPGSGSYSITLPPNSTPAPPTAKLIVETPTAQTATVTIAEDRPAGCSYVTQPESLTFSASGGTGQFNVVTTPSDCQWNLINGMSALGVTVTSGFSGRGNALVRYVVQAHTRTVDADGYLEIAGLSGLNPNGRHHIVIMKR
jgi:hypothetical protein